MSDSDSDWFDKDIDEFVVDVKDLKINDHLNKENLDNAPSGPSTQFFDAGLFLFFFFC